jgi:hypothetical protein
MRIEEYVSAMRWFSFTYEVERQHPGALEPSQREELDRGFLFVTQALGVARTRALLESSPSKVSSAAAIP